MSEQKENLMLSYFFIVVLLAISLAILIIQKGHEWPIKRPRIYLQLLMRKMHWKLPQALFCVVCSSFWMGLVADVLMAILSILLYLINSPENYYFYWFWPISGFVAAGMSWIIYEVINVLDKEPIINVDVGD